MLSVNLINAALKNVVPIETNGLQDKIMVQEWEEERKRHAVKIVCQLKKATVSKSEILRVEFTPLLLELSKSERDKISKKQDVKKIIQYVKDIVEDLNKFSDDILFAYSGWDLAAGNIWEFKIKWFI